jgi:hypothetical protein
VSTRCLIPDTDHRTKAQTSLVPLRGPEGVVSDFADLPDLLRADITAESWLLESEAAAYFGTRTLAGR